MLGFLSNGIASGSTAASMMSAAAVTNGGGVATGSTVAVLQSIGVVGVAAPIGMGLAAVGAAVGAAVPIAKTYMKREKGSDACSTVADSRREPFATSKL
ncbi:hypothetical protein PR003_g26195 [Phytophthora rubi]|uniref:Uncharacterized protein n=1 Tax=Phytophthora rubi TaxID=129364 RepID=A0A6A4CHH8_9STRA|nr:hypothetical protein PR002_g14141 [Phytophthora rubi]KAE9286886.1 hypothetical protein PR003_g26195 [Phytophthora rubi]